MTASGAAVLAIAAVLLLLPPRQRVPATRPYVAPVAEPGGSRLRRLQLPLSVLAAAGGRLVVGGTAGLVIGGLLAVVAWRVLGRAEDPAERRRQEAVRRDLPAAVHLLSACLAAGVSPTVAIRQVAEAMTGPVGEELGLVAQRLALGADPVAVWGELAAHPQLGPVGRTLARAHDSGASVTVAVERLAGELQERVVQEARERSRTVEVRSAVPLGLCYLPAFVLLGVVPLVAGIFGGLRLFG